MNLKANNDFRVVKGVPGVPLWFVWASIWIVLDLFAVVYVVLALLRR